MLYSKSSEAIWWSITTMVYFCIFLNKYLLYGLLLKQIDIMASEETSLWILYERSKWIFVQNSLKLPYEIEITWERVNNDWIFSIEWTSSLKLNESECKKEKMNLARSERQHGGCMWPFKKCPLNMLLFCYLVLPFGLVLSCKGMFFFSFYPWNLGGNDT